MSQPTKQEAPSQDNQAYSRNLPCLNPSCKSHGQPHPNCRCYSMAEGGEIGHYCSQDRHHGPGCAYRMAEGGETLQLHPDVQKAPKMSINEQALSALAHGGLSMLLGHPKSTYFGAFGSGPRRFPVKPEDDLNTNLKTYQFKVRKGSSHIDQGVESLFGGKTLDHAPVTDEEEERIKDYIEQGGLEKELQDQSAPTQMFAEGGQVQEPKREDPLSLALPDQSILLNSAKSRVVNHLNSIRPQPIQTKLPFDANNSNKAKQREYDKVVGLAARPLSILDHVRDGNLTPSTLKHFNSLYPELHDHLNKKITERITQAQLDDERPKYKTRQAMSLLLGSALDSTMTPASIMAAQGVFARQQAQQQPQQSGPKSKKNKSSLDKASQNFATGDQAAAARQKQ